jgi:purine-binding chemotaxis protein CheW
MTALHVLFTVGEVDYAVAADRVSELASFTGASRVPGAAAHVAGLVRIRARVLPLIDLRARFGLPEIPRDLDARVIVVREGEREVGLLCDRARELVKIDDQAFRPPPPVIAEQAAGFVDAVAQVGDRLVLQLDVGRVIGRDAIPEETTDGTQA